MWWVWHGHGNSGRGMAGWSWLFIILGIALLTGRSWGGMSWFIWPLLFFVIPYAIRLFKSNGMDGEATEKRKRENGDVIIVDKPKREPHYAVGDDGELVELYDDELNRDKRKRYQSEDELEYF